MIYRDFKGLKLSALGMGTMRLPLKSDKQTDIDVEQTAEMVEYAIKHGVNYFDTAWGYHDGASETVMGKILGEYPRESFYLATKFPGYDLSNMDKVEEIFEKQLEKTGTTYFDFYLVHNVCEVNIDAYLDEKYGIKEYLLKQKENGRIRHLGFSAHGNLDTMKKFLEVYGPEMEFGQLQLNYIDWTFQGAKEKAELLKEHNIPLWVMEPLRGGKLAKLPEQFEKQLKGIRPNEEIPAWAFRFLLSIPETTMILSGMSDYSQVKNNITTFEIEGKLDSEEMKGLLAVADQMTKTATLPCTACHYCTAKCPKGIDIPGVISLYNEYCFTGGGFLPMFGLMTYPKEKWPSACIACKSCEAVCPQQIKISDAMADFASKC